MSQKSSSKRALHPAGHVAAAAQKSDVRTRSKRSDRVAVLNLIAVMVFLAAVRIRLADVPLERDEGEYGYSGQLILQGIPPYQLAYNMKFPGTYYAYAVLLAIFGQTAWGVHIGLMVVNAGTIVLMFFLARRLLRDSRAAAITAIAFGFLSVDRWIMGTYGHATHFVVLAGVAGLLVLFHAGDSRRSSLFVLAGALLGMSVLMKQNGIFFFALGVGIAAWNGLRESPRRFPQSIIPSVLVALGGAIVFVLLCLLFAVQGVLGRFVFWTFHYAKEYVSQVSLSQAWGLFDQSLRLITQADTLIWLFAASGVLFLWVVRWPRDTRVILTALLIASFIAVAPGFFFREHYFILLLPV